MPNFISPADPASRWTRANGGLAFFAYCTNYLVDLNCAVIVDVEPTTAVRQAEVTAQHRMLDRPRLRGPNGAKDEFLLAATAQNLRKLAKLIPAPSQHAPG